MRKGKKRPVEVVIIKRRENPTEERIGKGDIIKENNIFRSEENSQIRKLFERGLLDFQGRFEAIDRWRAGERFYRDYYVGFNKSTTIAYSPIPNSGSKSNGNEKILEFQDSFMKAQIYLCEGARKILQKVCIENHSINYLTEQGGYPKGHLSRRLCEALDDLVGWYKSIDEKK